MSMPLDIDAKLEQRLAEWTARQPARRAVIVVGSRARSSHSADEWSDLDLVVFANDATSHRRHSAGLNNFGTVIAAVPHAFGQYDRTWIAVDADGTKLGAAFFSIDPPRPTATDFAVWLNRMWRDVILQGAK